MPGVLFSAELRWFGEGSPPATLERWFRTGPFPPGGGGTRRDEYLEDSKQRELGVKKRQGTAGIEIKGLLKVRPRPQEPFAGSLQFWTKWNSPALSIDHLPRIVVDKTRWLRKFDTTGADVRELALDEKERPRGSGGMLPAQGCGIELVSLLTDANQTRWWTFAFEAFGPSASLEQSLARTIDALTPPDSRALAQGEELSYPEWLATLRGAA